MECAAARSDTTRIGRVGVGICKDMSAVTATSLAGEHAMDESFRSALVDVIVVLAAWDSHDPTETVHNKWKARVRSPRCAGRPPFSPHAHLPRR